MRKDAVRRLGGGDRASGDRSSGDRARAGWVSIGALVAGLASCSDPVPRVDPSRPPDAGRGSEVPAEVRLEALRNGGFEHGDTREPGAGGFDGTCRWRTSGVRNRIRASRERARSGAFGMRWEPIGWTTRRDGAVEDAATFLCVPSRAALAGGAKRALLRGYADTGDLHPQLALEVFLADDQLERRAPAEALSGGIAGWREFRASLPLRGDEAFVYVVLQVPGTRGTGAPPGSRIDLDDIAVGFVGDEGVLSGVSEAEAVVAPGPPPSVSRWEASRTASRRRADLAGDPLRPAIATLRTASAPESLRARFPELEEAACRDPDGRTVAREPECESEWLLCSGHPAVTDVLVRVGVELLESDPDLLVLDEAQGAELSFFWGAPPGFCRACLRAYREHLESRGEEPPDPDRLIRRLDAGRTVAWSRCDPLVRELWRLQERRNFEARSRLASRLRERMEARGRVVPLGVVLPACGLDSFAGYRLPALKWSLLCEVPVVELSRPELLPRGKWVAETLLAGAAFRGPTYLAFSRGRLRRLVDDQASGRSRRGGLLYGLFAETRALGGTLLGGRLLTGRGARPEAAVAGSELWESCESASRFVRRHAVRLEARGRSLARVAVLHVENEALRDRTASVRGVAQALVESSIPFDTLVDGDGRYLPVELAPERLDPYETVYVPCSRGLEPSQREAILHWAAAGGTLVLPDPEEFPVPRRQDEVAYGRGRILVPRRLERPDGTSCDLGTAYRLSYEDEVRRRIAALARRGRKPGFELLGADRTVWAVPSLLEDRGELIVHVVNSDYDGERDEMRPKEGLRVRLRAPAGWRPGAIAYRLSPDGGKPEGREVSTPIVRAGGGWVEVEVGRVAVWTVVVLPPASPGAP